MSTLAQDKSIPSYCFLRPRPRFVDTLASQANAQPGAQRGKDAAERGGVATIGLSHNFESVIKFLSINIKSPYRAVHCTRSDVAEEDFCSFWRGLANLLRFLSTFKGQQKHSGNPVAIIWREWIFNRNREKRRTFKDWQIEANMKSNAVHLHHVRHPLLPSQCDRVGVPWPGNESRSPKINRGASNCVGF